MKPPFRLWGKKRGKRMSGWWLIGRVGQTLFFGSLMLLGIVVLTTVIGWQLISPETNAFSIGYGFWLLVIIGVSFIGIGGVGVYRQIVAVAISDEHRVAISTKTSARKRELGRDANDRKPESTFNSSPFLPAIGMYTDSPGTYLQFRLPETNSHTNRLLMISLLILIWNGFVMMMAAIVAARFIRGQGEWFAAMIVGGFIVVMILLTKRFLKDFFYATRVGSTVVELDRLPLEPGNACMLQLVQHGRMSLKSLKVSLVCDEKVTYHFGTDVRVESQEVERLPLLEQQRIRVEDGNPLRLQCPVSLPARSMHSFSSPHNAIGWRVEVEGKVSRWPSFCRSFPVVVFPKGVAIETPIVPS
jgi:hypothetical protein